MKLTLRCYCASALVSIFSQPLAAQVPPQALSQLTAQETNAAQTDQTLDVLHPISTLESIRSSNLSSRAETADSDMGSEGRMGMDGMMGASMVPSEKQVLLQHINQLRQMLLAPDQDRKELEPLLREALSEYFVLDMEERVREFDKIRARVVQMESKLQARLDRRYEVVELQIKQMLHKADGLDFFVPDNAAGGLGTPGATMGGMGMDMGGMEGMAGMAGMAGMGGEGGSMGAADGMGMMSGYGGSGAMVAEVPTVPGYDIGFAMTRYLRFPGKPLKPTDPLNIYASLDAKSDRENDLSKISAGTSDAEKLKNLLLAMHNFENIYKHLPAPANRRDRSEKPHSWRVALLPILGQAELYKQYRFDQPWDSENNIKLVERMPAIFGSKDDPNSKDGKTRFQMLVGNGAAFDPSRPTEFRDITDGSSNTIAVVIAATSVPWTQPDDIPFVPNAMFAKLATSGLVGMCDGSTRRLSANEKTLTALATRAGGEIVPE